MMTATRFTPQSLMDVYTVGRLRVLIEQATGEVVSIQDAVSGCAASLMYCKAEIANAQTAAHLAWASTADHS
jgi:hypothetical protein